MVRQNACECVYLALLSHLGDESCHHAAIGYAFSFLFFSCIESELNFGHNFFLSSTGSTIRKWTQTDWAGLGGNNGI